MKRLLLFALFALLLAPTSFAQTAEELFQQATQKERVEGDLNGAIELLERVVETSTDRNLTARALLRLGKVHELSGTESALATYRILVSEFSDQTQEVAEAKLRISGLHPEQVPENGLASFWSDSLSWSNKYSFDRSLYVGVYGNAERIAYQQLDGNDEIRFIEPRNNQVGLASPLPSLDNSKIAYTTWDYRGTDSIFGQVAVFDVELNTSRIILSPKNTYYEIVDWSSDGKRLLVLANDDEVYDRLELIDVETAEVVTAAELPLQYSRPECLVHDDSSLFTAFVDGNPKIKKLNLFTGDTVDYLPQSENFLIACSSQAGWAIVNDNSFGLTRTWAYRISDAGLESEPQSIPSIPDAAVSFGFVGNTFHYQHGSARSTRIFSYDENDFDLIDQLERTENLRVAGWSKDASKFASNVGGNEFLIRHNDREWVIITEDHSTWTGWTSDASMLITVVRDNETEELSTLWIDPSDGTTLFETPRPGFPSLDPNTLWTWQFDDNELCFLAAQINNTGFEDLFCFETKQQVGYLSDFDFSPDGKLLSFISRTTRSPESILWLVDTSSGEVYLEYSTEMAHSVEWAPDGKEVILLHDRRFTRFDRDGKELGPAFPRLSMRGRIFPIRFALHPTSNVGHFDYWQAGDDVGTPKSVILPN